jgi:hypothetical protein
MRRVFNDALISAGALTVLLVALVSVDERVRDYVVRSARGADISSTGAMLQGLGAIVMEAALDQSVAHAPLAIFVVAGVVLFLCMVRT